MNYITLSFGDECTHFIFRRIVANQRNRTIHSFLVASIINFILRESDEGFLKRFCLHSNWNGTVNNSEKKNTKIKDEPLLNSFSSACLCITSLTICSNRELFSFWRNSRAKARFLRRCWISVCIRSKLFAKFDSSPTSY